MSKPGLWMRRACVTLAASALLATGMTAPAAAAVAPADLTWDALSAPLPQADLLDVEFDAETGTATDASAAAHPLTLEGTAATIAADAELGRDVATFAGSGSWFADWSGGDYAKQNDGATIEALFNPSAIASGYTDVIGNMQSAGFGLEIVRVDAQTARIEVYAHVGGGYKVPKATIPWNQWTHVVASFDGATVKLYVDGDLKSTVDAVGTLSTPNPKRWYVGADSANGGGAEARFTGDLAIARVYGEPVGELDAHRLSRAALAALDVVKPLVRAAATPAEHADLGVEYTAPAIEAADDSGVVAGRTISVTDPSGTTSPLDLERPVFTPAEDGVYTLTYQALDAADNVGTAEYRVAAGDAELPGPGEPTTDPEPTTPQSTADGVVDWKFSSIGDIHDNWDELKEAFAFWSEQGVTDTLWPGDLTNSATASEFNALKATLDEVSGYGIDHYISPGNHDVNGDLSTYGRFEAATGQRPNAEYIVNGYRVISVSPGAGTFTEDAPPAAGTESSAGVTTGNSGAYAYAANWLNARLAAATAAEPEKPVFVLVHHPIRCTHYVSNEWYGSGLATGCGDDFESFLENYPQAVVWGGHIHIPNHIPTSIWQGTEKGGGFTTVNAPPLAYYEMESGVIGANSNSNDTTPDDAGNNRETAIVEVDGSHVKITNYDLQADMWEPTVWEWDIADSLDTTRPFAERFPLGDARADRTAAPVWQQDDAITVSAVAETTAQVDWTQAEAAPNPVHDIVQTYLVEVVDKNTNQVVRSFKRWSRYYVMPLPATVGHQVWGLSAGTDYEVRISPINAWGKKGQALTKTFRTAGIGADQVSSFATHGAPMPVADLIDVDVESLTDVAAHETPYPLTGSGGAPATSLPLQAVFTEADKATVVDGYTEDVAFTANGPGDVLSYGQPSAVQTVLRVLPMDETHGTLTTVASVQGEVLDTGWTQTIVYGQPHHAALRFTGSALDMWVDGERVGTMNVDAQLAPALGMPGVSYSFVVGGSGDGQGGILSPLDGEVTAARGFSVPLSDVEMTRIAPEAQPAIDHVLPAVRAVSAPAKTGTTGSEYTVPQIETVDDSGRISATSVTVTGPWGDTVYEAEGAGAFVPAEPGSYRIVYAATDGAGNRNEAAYGVQVVIGSTTLPITDEEKLAEYARPLPAADLLDLGFWGGEARDESPAAHMLVGNPAGTVGADAELGRDVATVNGSQAWYAAWSDADYAKLNDGMTVEAVFRTPSYLNGEKDLISNQQSAGMGLAVDSGDGTRNAVELWIHLNGSYKTLKSAALVEPNTWHHVAATYDGAMARLYLDGVEVATAAGTGEISTPGPRRYYIGSDTNSSGNPEFTFQGSIATARLYGQPVTPVTVARLAASELTGDDTQAPVFAPLEDGTAMLGDSVAIAKPTVRDDAGADPAVEIAVAGPDGPVEVSDGAFTPATAGTYTVTFTATDAAGNTATASYDVVVESAETPVLESAKPTIGGTAKVDATVTARPGTWTAGTAFAFQWRAGGTAIEGATSATLKLAPGLAGKKLTVTVTGSKGGFEPVSQTSDAVTVAAGTLTGAAPAISGTAKVDSTVSAKPGTWTSGTKLAYQWLADGKAVSGATASTYKVAASLSGKTLTVKVTGSKAGYATLSKTSAGRKIAAGTLTGATPAISGTVKVDSTVSAKAGTWTSGTRLAYQWYANGLAISKATGTSLRVPASLSGKSLTVKVTGTKAGYTTLSKVSAGKKVAAGTLAGATPAISGTVKVGAKVTAKPGTWTSGAKLAYQWYANGKAIGGARSSSYTIAASIAGQKLTVKATGTKAGYTTLAKTSAAKTIAKATLKAGTPAIGGAAKVGATLTAKPGAWTSGTRLTYQWYASGKAIRGATKSTYTVAKSLKGKTLTVKVTGTKTGYTTVAKTSKGTAKVR